MKIKIDFIAGELSVIKLKGVLDAVEQSVETPGQPVSSQKFKQSTGGGRNQLVPLLLKSNNQTSTKKETWRSKNSVFCIANSQFQDAFIVDQLKNEGFSNNDISALFPDKTLIGLGIREFEERRFSLSIPGIQRKSNLRKKPSKTKTPGQRTFARRADPVLPNITTTLILRWQINNR